MIRCMHIAYLDDSGTSTDTRYQIVAGVILKDSDFSPLEGCLGYIIAEDVPENLKEDFEFHAHDLFQGSGAFKDLKPESKRLKIFSNAVEMITALEIPIIYGAIDRDRARTVYWGSAHPISIGFRICAAAFEEWIVRQNNDSPGADLGLMVFDATTDKELIKTIRGAFRDYRPLVRSVDMERGQLRHIHDDLYFGDSASSCGIQAADICAFLINRHLSGRLDTEPLFRQLEPLIVSAQTVPE
jgi:hypothetical protein